MSLHPDEIIKLMRERDEAVAEVARLKTERDEARGAVREAFIDGARWGFFEAKGATMFPSELDEARDAAEARYPHAPWVHLERIKELDAEVARLRAALKEIRETAELDSCCCATCRIARKALEGK